MKDNVIKSFEAGEDLQVGILVKIQDGKVYKANNVTDAILGVTDSSVKKGKAADVILAGVAYVQVAGATNVGDILVAKEDGKAQAFSFDIFADLTADTTVHTVGKVLEADETGAYLQTAITNTVLIVPKQKTTDTEPTNEEKV